MMREHWENGLKDLSMRSLRSEHAELWPVEKP